MSGPDREIIQDKLGILLGYYKELKELGEITWEEYIGNNLYKRTVERLLQLIVEVATDINNIFLKSLGKGPTPDYFSSFVALAEAEIIPMDFARGLLFR